MDDQNSITYDEKEIIFSREDISIYYDTDYKVRVKTKSSCTQNIIKVQDMVAQINNLPMSKKMRQNYGREIAKIYQLAYTSNIDEAEKFYSKLLSIIENNLIIYKKIEFIIPSLILTLVCILITNKLLHLNLLYQDAFIYGPLGGILSVIIDQNSLNIDYKVERYILWIESVKRIVISIIVSIIGIISIKSKFIFSNINFNENIYMEYLVLILCGYSQTFIPNLLDKLNVFIEKE